MATQNPPVGFHFKVEFALGGVTDSDVRFQEVSGISRELEVEPYKEGGENRFVHKFPVRANYPDLVLKRGLMMDTALRKWCHKAINDLDIEPVTVYVKLLNDAHEPLQTYVFHKAWPRKWSVSDLNAETSALVVESLELSYQYFKIQN